jgi:hypothetical protein
MILSLPWYFRFGVDVGMIVLPAYLIGSIFHSIFKNIQEESLISLQKKEDYKEENVIDNFIELR